ncbi:unnamed protein product [Didymodactylos carnosus]|uniref:WWE domain-containing protein n=1 Tax=Didymodactylos carnosus TaxID=1234261 RepID=A0A815EMR2_9BILA|nr:unnamed protein product [Didymodactylos carnosus]CAF1313638.1 unnamed protein product [Didymodactylos carnosus]CAF3986156.1 unnamed protein product [Didymodactylos carnosus]CAF4153583.1 unnamed protein product [Didymodactylos carnosus]
MSADESSDDTEIFQVEVGFHDENECRSVLEPLANQNQCSFEQQFGVQKVALTVPRSFADDNHQQRASTVLQSITVDGKSFRLGIYNGEIKVLLEAIEYQVADIIAICSESGILRNIVLTAAGTAVSAEYQRIQSQQPWLETPPGSLKCKKIVHYTLGLDALNICLTLFVKMWVANAYDNNYQSIAFGVENPAFASSMIALVKQSLERHRKPLSVLFVISERDLAKITLKSSSSSQPDLKKCRSEMEEVCKNSLIKSLIENTSDLREWTQSTVKRYFEFCVGVKQVLPRMDIGNGIVELKGSAAHVEDCKNYFNELNSGLLNQAKKVARAQSVVWSYVHPETNQWAQYPIKLNAEIEDAFQKRLPVQKKKNQGNLLSFRVFPRTG